jgi:hypothetical protein
MVHVPQPSPSGESSAVDDSLRLGLGLGLGLGLPIVLIAVYGAYTLVKAPGAGKEVTQPKSEEGTPGQSSLSADLALPTQEVESETLPDPVQRLYLRPGERMPGQTSLSADLALPIQEAESETLPDPVQRLYVQPASSTLEISR